ncbi:BTAD domain-containing putative transcriptional regulator [Streptomyces sp. NPDC035033]|uniref:AfsR/SARP family transcriptional regulator n=1 Tax=Streptomyces sp. NPDC035033 TaxID=3155368 RepID=UPI0034022539
MLENTSDPGLDFRILGSLECRLDGVPVSLRGRLQERLLAHLLLSRNQVVPLARLVEGVWDDASPETAPHQIRKMVSDLRQRLPPLKGLLTAVGPGYRLALDDASVDQGRFEAGTALARVALRDGQQRRALGHLASALALWRGPLLGEPGSRLLQAASDALEEQRVTALEQFFDVHIALGESDGVLEALREAVNDHPTRETLCGQLMVALYRGDRQAEALDEYHRLRRVLDESHAIEPGPVISALYQRILRGDPELAGPAAAPDITTAEPAEPPEINTLPYDLPDFTGRNQVLDILDAVGSGTFAGAPCGAAGNGGPRIVAIDGMGGSGKSALAIHAAHRVAALYPDGRLYLDLQGFTPGAHPMSEHEALALLLGSMGVPDESLSTNSGLLTARWRSLTSRRRVLLVLDNAVSAAQVRPLLPHSSESLVIVTSRRRLSDLDGAIALSPGMLAPAESVALLEGVLGRARVRAEEDQAWRIAKLCGHLPLALRICAARLLHRTHWRLRELADRLAEQSRIIDELSSGERSLWACLSTSYEALGAGRRRVLRQLASLPVRDFDSHMAAAVLGTGPMETEHALEALLDDHLLEQRARGRYSFHDLVRAFAIARPPEGAEAAGTGAGDAVGAVGPAAGGDGRGVRDGGGGPEGADVPLARLMEYLARVSDIACAQLFPGRAEPAEGGTAAPARLPTIVDVESALTWFDAEQRGMLAVLRAGAATPWHELTSTIARNLVFYLHMRGTAELLRESAAIGLAAARALGDGHLIRISLTNVGVALWRLGRFDEAVRHLEGALSLAVAAADVPGQVSILNRLGVCHERTGRYAQCEAVLLRALALLRDHPAPQEEATARNSLSTLYSIRGEYADAREHAESALRLDTAVDASTRINLLNALATALLCQEAPEAARERLAEALGLDRRMGGTQAGVHSLVLLAETHIAQGDPGRAWESVDEALSRLDGGPSVHSCVTLRTAGRVHLALGHAARAQECFTAALEYAEATGYRLESARARSGLAAVAEHEGRIRTSAEHQEGARAIYEELGLPATRLSRCPPRVYELPA